MNLTDQQKEALAIVMEAATNELDRCEKNGWTESYDILVEALYIVHKISHPDQA